MSGADPVTGEVRVSFRAESCLLSARAIELPCGKCIGCRKARARAWAVRCLHEARCHKENAFVTLTYSPENLPSGLVVRDLQLFFKKLRHHSKAKFRYYAVGEYGEKMSRPHYHVLLFGYDFPDKRFHKGCAGQRQFRSEILDAAWPHGHALSGSVTAQSAQYCASYAVKEMKRDRFGEFGPGRPRPFSVMSRNPGIGARWLDQFSGDLFPRDFVVLPGGAKSGIPRYYLDRFGAEEVEGRAQFVEELKARRVARHVVEDEWVELARRKARALFVEARDRHFNERRERNEAASLCGTG